jgi:asparagine synthase (glutamine-hydrolysing)
MCGISGFLLNNPTNDFCYEKVISIMSNMLAHRGPDDSGIWVNKEDKIALGHRRLSILDLSSAGSQPMHSECSRFVLCFNGEIYNHHNLRKELDSNIKWRGSSDTETLLKLFELYEVKEALNKIRGMFAIALWDKKNHILHLARDRIGEKPLYYGWVKNNFVFASELKSITSFPKFNNYIDQRSLAGFFRLKYIPAPFTIFENIFKLEPGKYCSINLHNLSKKVLSSDYYWNIDTYNLSERDQKERDIQSEVKIFDQKLTNAVESQMISDVPIGSFLSGGIDSSLITSLMQKISNKKIDTFTIGFQDNEFDESNIARHVSNHLKTNHHELILTPENTIEATQDIMNIYDEPFADSSQIPTYILSKFAREHVTVALSGDGGDELFGGYNRYIWTPKIWNSINWLPVKIRNKLLSLPGSLKSDALNRLLALFPISRPIEKLEKLNNALLNVKTFEDFYINLAAEPIQIEKLMESKPYSVLEDLLSQKENFSLSPVKKMIRTDMLTYLPDDILCKVDRASMAVSLETRAPYLDRDIVEYALNLPINFKIRGYQGKVLPREALRRYVPHEILSHPKTGFSIPIGKWLRNELKDWAHELIISDSVGGPIFCNNKLINQAWDEHQNNKSDWTHFLWSVLIFKSWADSQSSKITIN